MTPEHELWAAGLRTFIEDASKSYTTPGDTVHLLRELKSGYTTKICDFIGVEHEYLIAHVMKLLERRVDNLPKYS